MGVVFQHTLKAWLAGFFQHPIDYQLWHLDKLKARIGKFCRQFEKSAHKFIIEERDTQLVC